MSRLKPECIRDVLPVFLDALQGVKFLKKSTQYGDLSTNLRCAGSEPTEGGPSPLKVMGYATADHFQDIHTSVSANRR